MFIIGIPLCMYFLLIFERERIKEERERNRTKKEGKKNEYFIEINFIWLSVET